VEYHEAFWICWLVSTFNGDRDRSWPCLACVRDAAGPVRAGAHVYEPERMHLSLFSNTHSLCWPGATKAMATGPGGARVLAVLFESLPRTPRSLAFARGYRCRARTTQWRARVVVSRSLAETARVTITTGFTCVSTPLEAGGWRLQPSRGARDRSCTAAAVQSQLLGGSTAGGLGAPAP